MDDEMRAHIALEAEWLEASGVTPDEARRRAAASFGGVAHIMEEARDAWPLRWVERLWTDVCYAVRSLAHSPSFAITSVAALGLGMAANMVMFNVVDAVAFRPLAVENPEDLVALYTTQGEARLLGFSYPSFEYFRERSRTLEDLAAVAESPVSVLHPAGPTVEWAAHVSDNYFTMLGVRPKTGSLIQPGQLHLPVVVLSHRFWSTRFTGNDSAIGQTLVVNGTPLMIVGVAPPQFDGTRLFTYNPSLWIPVGLHNATIPSSGNLLTNRRTTRFLVVGRKHTSIGIERVRQDVNALANEVAASFPDIHHGLRVDVFSNRVPINPWLAPAERVAWIARLLMVGISLVLAVACSTVITLLLARSTARRHEMALRLSLGASTGRLLRQLLTESLVLAAIAGVVAVLLTSIGNRALLGIVPPLEFASTWRPTDGSRALVYGLALTIGTALVCGLVPALKTIRLSIGSALNGQLPLVRAKLGRLQLRELLVVSQVAVSVIVLAAALLLTRSLRNAQRIDPGFTPEGVVVLTLDPHLLPTYDSARTAQLYRAVEARLERLPNVVTWSRSVFVPLDGNSMVRRVLADGQTTELDRAPAAEYNLSAPNYFRTIGTTIVDGRDFVPGDTAAIEDVVIVNEALARRVWGDEPAVGKRIRLESAASAPMTVIGVARTANHRSVGEQPRPAIWRNLRRVSLSRSSFIVRTTVDEASMLPLMRRAVQEVDPSLPIIGLSSLRDRIALAYSPIASSALAVSSLAVIACILALSGVTGLVAYGISQRRQEISVRVALGARPAAVVWLIVRRSLGLTACGALAGIMLIAFGPWGLDSLLYQVRPWDPATLGVTALVFMLVTGAAALLPAGRASVLSPIRALRVDG